RYSVMNKAGWCMNNQAYILPSGETLRAENKARVIYNGDKSQAESYTASGSLEDWQQHIARYIAGNSRLCLAVGTALAAPLGRLLNIEAGGFHLFGDSRDGKSTAARVALSIWGNPEALMLTWTGTGLGFTNTAAARNDGLLVLDEIGQANAKAVAQTAYAVINGVSKVQGAKDGGNREISRWRVFVLSTGEKPLHGFLRTAGVEWNAGQAARLPDIPSDAGQGFGIFDTLHGHHKGAALSEELNANAARYHGTAGRAFVELLLSDPETVEQAREYMAAFMAILPDTDGQARTVALRFALAAAALETAAAITGIGQGVGTAGVKQCFDDWLKRTGTGKFEDNQIIRQATDFFDQYGHSVRFATYPLPKGHKIHENSAGYITSDEQYLVIPAIFEREICQSFEPRKVCDVLHGIGWLQKGRNRYTIQRRIAGSAPRFYIFTGAVPPEF
ncbi:MAG: DUF927 domain-containing protein, partial [Neisseria sp.]|nr:DUF927 domain-containing protein [Neisseria sp.]